MDPASGRRPGLRPFQGRGYLAHWLRDGDLGSVRGADALAKLPAEERQAWAKLWADVEALLRKAQERRNEGVASAGPASPFLVILVDDVGILRDSSRK